MLNHWQTKKYLEIGAQDVTGSDRIVRVTWRYCTHTVVEIFSITTKKFLKIQNSKNSSQNEQGYEEGLPTHVLCRIIIITVVPYQIYFREST